jgi:aspartyl-tRNA(Asn)/glutamyl-tRNA(Gln) amidotransferase subunit A
MSLSWTLDRLGPMCRSVEDCRLVLAAIDGHDPDDPSSAARPMIPDRDPSRPFRLATVKSPNMKLHPAVESAYETSLEVLRQFAEFTEIELPEIPYGPVVGTIISCEAAAAFESFIAQGKSWELHAPEDRWGCHSNLMIPAVDYIQAQRIRGVAQRAVDKLLIGVDAVVSPTLAVLAPPSSGSFADAVRGFVGSPIGAAGTASGLPALTVPNGFSDDELPTGLQFVSRAWDDESVLAVAAEYQRRTDWHTRHPKVDN